MELNLIFEFPMTLTVGDIAPGLRTLFNLDIPDSARVGHFLAI